MGLHRIVSLTLTVPSVAATSTFLRDFGLRDVDRPGAGSTAAGVSSWLSTRDGGAQVELVEGPRRGLRRLVLGATDGDDVARLAARVRAWDERLDVVETAGDDAGPMLCVHEPVTGLAVEVRVAPPVAGGRTRPAVNGPGKDPERIDEPADAVLRDEPVEVSNLTHLVYGSPDQPATLRFFTEALGFEVSDEVPGIIAFTRCGEVHHNLAVQAAPVSFVHHVAFEVDGVDDVVRGGTAMIAADPERQLWGIGRHAIGSNWFWYLREPGGTFIEYTADIDRISRQDLYRPKQWSGHEFIYSFGPPVPSEFLEPRDMADLIAAG